MSVFMLDFTKRENRFMKFIRFLGVLWILFPCMSFAASSSDFQNASKLLSAARRGDIQTVQILINNGANINYTDSTGLSLVCTAVMNNDKRAIQVLQMYGADASSCDRQIKNYKQKTRVAAHGEEYGFFSGLSSSHVILLSAVGVAAVIGGVALLTDSFKAKNNNSASSSGGSHSGGGGGSSSGSGSQWGTGTTPYGPAYLTSTGEINKNADIAANLALWDTRSQSGLKYDDYNYLRNVLTVENVKTSQAKLDGLNPLLENYLLDMHGYHSFANGYMGQYTFRNSSNTPELPKLKDALSNPLQGRPVRVALITGNGINPYGSANSAKGIMYAINNTTTSQTPIVDKYINNTLSVNSEMTVFTETENEGFDLSGSGSVFNPFADVNDSALAKIVAGWEAGGRTNADLYGFVPNGQLAIFRTGDGVVWNKIDNATSGTPVGTITDTDGILSDGDIINLTGIGTFTIKTALSQKGEDSTVNVGGTKFKLAENSKMFVGVCTSDCENNIGIYIGTDGAWYVNYSGGNNIDGVYISDSGRVYNYKTKSTDTTETPVYVYSNFSAMKSATTISDVVANTNVLSNSRQYSYLTVDNFTKAAAWAGVSDLNTYYATQITNNYGTYTYYLNDTLISEAQGNVANNLFLGYNNLSMPMIVMPAGDYLLKDAASGTTYYDTLSATFENYAPMIYGTSLKHDFMTVVGVSHAKGNSEADTISAYGNGINSAYGKLQLSLWVDDNEDIYSSRKCGLAGVGGSGVDPWCFAASGPTAEMATAAAAGAVASVKSAFSYMTTDQIFTLLALTAEGPYLKTDTNGQTLVDYLQSMYELPLEYKDKIATMSDSEYLEAFKDVFGYGLINIERAIKPGYSIFYYSDGNIVSSPLDAYWGNGASSSKSSSRASTVLGRSGTLKTSFFDIVESADGSVSLPRVWNAEISLNNNYKHGLYMGDVLAEFSVDSTNKHTNRIGNMTFDMAMSPRAYNDNFNGLDNLNVKFSNENYDLEAGYQRYLTDGESRFDGRANGVLSLIANSVSSGAKYKSGHFAFGARAFSGTVTDENLLENDPVVSSQFEPARLGLANGGAMDVAYNNDKFNIDLSFGNMHETNTVLGSISDGLLSLNGADTQYIDAVANYKPFEKVKLSMHATFANTHANVGDGIISSLSDIKSNAFALGADLYGFNFTAAMPLAAVDGKMGYDYADLSVVESDGKYDVAINNPHTEYIDLAAQKRELRFSGSYKKQLGKFTDAGIGFIYRVNPGNTDVFGNESLLMFKLHHRLGI